MVHGAMACGYGGRFGWTLAVLCCAGGSLAGVCNCSRRSTRPSTSCVLTGTGSGGSNDLGDYLNWAAAHYGGSDPSGAGLQSRPPVFAPGSRGGDGFLEGPRPMGSKPRGSGNYILEGDRGTYGELGGEEGEVQQCVGAGRRHGVCVGRGLEQSPLLHPVCAGDGWNAGGPGGSHSGTVGGDGQEGEDPAAAAVCGFRYLVAVRQEALEDAKVQVLRDDARRLLHHEDGAGTCLFSTLAVELQGPSNHVSDDGSGGAGKPDAVGEQDRDAEPPLRKLLASDSGGRRQRKRGANGQNLFEGKDGHRCWGAPTERVGCGQTVASGLAPGAQRPGLLAGTSSPTSDGLDGKRIQRYSHAPRRGDHKGEGEGKERRLRLNSWRGRSRIQEEQQSSEEGSQEEKMGSGKRGAEILEGGQRKRWKGWRRKVWWSWPRWCWQSRRRRMLRMEQWEWVVWGPASRLPMQRKSAETAQMHSVQVSGSSFEGLPSEEGFWKLMAHWFGLMGFRVKSHAEGEGDPASSQQAVGRKEKGTKRKRYAGGDPPDKRDAPKDMIVVDGEYMDFEGYCGVREFVFLHHFSGEEDRLGDAVKEEAARLGLKVTTRSADIKKGHDLGADKPFKSHHYGAYMADIDGYHSGFPCNTYTKLRWRPLQGHPGPLRSKEEPYGFKNLTPEKKAEVDRGTIYMARSVDMVKAMEEGHKDMMVKGFATLENPPPSDHPKHISAWRMPELYQLVNTIPNWESAHFNTCAYELELEAGTRHYKPQLVGGTLPGLQGLSKACPCGNVPHEPIVGKDKSAKSAAYPREFCKAYGKLAALHFQRMAKAEFLEGRRELVEKSIAKRKKLIQKYEEGKERYEMSTAEIETRFPRELAVGRDRLEARRREPTEEGGDRRGEPPDGGGPGNTEADDKRPMESTSSTKAAEEEKTTAEAQEALHWKGGEGNYGMVRKKEERVCFQPVGGMRDPHLAVRRYPTVQALGKRMWACWEEFARSNKQALLAAETYGTEACEFDLEMVGRWKAKLAELWDPPKKQGLNLKPNNIYYTPVDTEMIRGWQRKSGDPEKWVPYWLEVGAPLGIERSIQTAGIFPVMEAEEERHQGEWDSDVLLEKGEMKNYKSVEEDREQAEIELNRYLERKFCMAIPRSEAQEKYQGGTISKMGLILKTKDNGEVKRRLVLDMRRSGGNAKSRLPERLTLPRPLDVIKLLRHMHRNPRVESCNTEFALVDVADAFTLLPVAPAEWKHTMTPSLQEDEVLIFQALLFGYKVAPLLYSRFAAMLARMLQSALEDGEAAHQVYLDDSLWCLRGSLQRRSLLLAFVLNTTKAVGVPVAITKGALKVTWIGVTFEVEEQDTVVMGIPIKFAAEMKELLESWSNRGYAPVRELRVAAGKAAWLGGVLPRARWLTTVFYAVLTDTLKEEEKEKDKEPAPGARNRRGLFPVKRLELARQWAIKFLEAAMKRPLRRINLRTVEGADIRLMTDASPEGLGGLLSINGRVLKAFSSPVEPEDGEQLGIELGSSSSQAVLEALAILVGLRHFASYLRGQKIKFTVQADSVAALALTQKLSAGASSSAMNFIGAELGITLEELEVQEIAALHIPGKANVEPDFLSRPSKWKEERMPAGLHGVEIDPVSGRSADFYRLPSPMVEPSLWGQKGSAAGIAAAWEAMQ